MAGSLKPAEFFVLEAGEYLERLASLVAKADGPKPDELVRYARALRGSALMANQPDFAGAAGGMEALARAFRDGTLTWSADVRESASQAVDNLKGLLRHAPQWSGADTAAAERVAKDLGRLSGENVPHPHRRTAETGQELNTGVRAFVAREGALIASALDRAARALRQDRDNMDPVHNVVRRMQSLRGLAELADLAPLPDILDALELAAGDLTRSQCAPPGVAEVFASGAVAMTRLSRDVADHGVPVPDSDESVRFTDAIIQAFALEQDVVEIDALAPAGEPAIVSRGDALGLDKEDLPSVELVSHGEHLAELAHGLRRAASASERRLRLYTLMDALRAMGQRVGSVLAPALQAIYLETKRLLQQAADAQVVDRFATVLQGAGSALGEAHTGAGVPTAAARLEALTGGLGLAPPEPPRQPESIPAPTAARADATDRPSTSAAVEEEIIAIGDLAPDPGPGYAPFGVVEPEDPFPSTPSADVPFGVGLAGGLRSYDRARRESSTTPPSIEALAGDEGGPSEPTAPDPEAEVVSIGTLVYRGDAAWDRALTLRSILVGSLSGAGDLAEVRPLVEELLDLLPLASDSVR